MKDIIEKIRALVTEAATNPKSHAGIAVYDSGVRDGMRDLAKSVLAILPAMEVPEHPMIVNVEWIPDAEDPAEWMNLRSMSRNSADYTSIEWAIFHSGIQLTHWFKSKDSRYEPEVFWIFGKPKVFWIDTGVSPDEQQFQYSEIQKYLDETYPQTPLLAEFQWLDGEKVGPWAIARSRTSDRDEWALFAYNDDRRLTHWLRSPAKSLEPIIYCNVLGSIKSFWIDVSVQDQEHQYNAVGNYLNRILDGEAVNESV